MVSLTYLTALIRKLALKTRRGSQHFAQALMESRMRKAEIELRRHLLPRELETAAWKLSARSEDSLPFVR